MRESEVQQRVTELPQPKSKTREEGSESVEEPSRALHVTLMQRLRRHERIRLLILSMGLFVTMLSTVFFVFSGSIVLLFATIVVVPLCYWCVDRYLKQSETATQVT
jgi:Flp pilus assembly protein TadB